MTTITLNNYKFMVISTSYIFITTINMQVGYITLLLHKPWNISSFLVAVLSGHAFFSNEIVYFVSHIKSFY